MALHLGTDRTSEAPYHLSASRLTTHGVVFGMTGSGKTGLCIDLLEEAALSGVPILAIDPKGDLANLGRAWPPEAADRWTEGLRASGVGDERVAALREQVEVRIFTPGSTSGQPIDVLGILSPPPGADAEDIAGAATTAASAILGLAGVHGDPVRDPRLVVATTVLVEAWQRGESLTAEQLVLRLVDPPFAKVGVFPVDTFLPRKERMDTAMALNGVLASPSFAAWQQGVALDIDALLTADAGRTPVNVLYLAHLDDGARTFFVTLLLSRLLAWSRQQPGHDGLRALLFFDEVFGFLPPHPKDPTTKRPLLTLMKQARAVGLGVVLCTQNPVDVDYKALSNAGWWAVGRLSTAQDRDRVLDGMTAVGVDRGALADTIASLPPWSFAIRDVRDDAVRTVSSRWAISYLGGPVTPSQLEAWAVDAPVTAPARQPVAATAPAAAPGLPEAPPMPAGLEERWLAPSARWSPPLVEVFGPSDPDGPAFQPALWVQAELRFDERGFAHDRVAHRLFWPLTPDAAPTDVVIPAEAMQRTAHGRGTYEVLPNHLDEAREVDAMRRAVVDALFDGETTELYAHGPTKLKSEGGESREAFQARVVDAVQDAIDARVAQLRSKVEREVDRLEDKRRKVQRDLEKHQSDAQARLATEVVNAGETLFGMLFGGRSRSLTTAMSKRQATSKARDRASQAETDLVDLEREIYDAGVTLEDEIRAITNEERRSETDIDVTAVGLERNDVRVSGMTLLWVPMHQGA